MRQEPDPGDNAAAAEEATYVALLRGVNVGRANRVAMADLRELAGRLGFSDARTLLNSGNLVFTARGTDSARVAGRLRDALVSDLGVSTRVVVFTASELADAIAANPLSVEARDPSRFLVAFLESAADTERLEPLTALDWGDEAIEVGKRAAYLWCPDGVIASRVAKALERALGGSVTARNWTTVTKLAALAADR